MMNFGRIIMYAAILCVCIYTASYGRWTWKKKNKLGAVVLFILSITVVALPIYTLYFRDR
jgi:hypothetical protein